MRLALLASSGIKLKVRNWYASDLGHTSELLESAILPTGIHYQIGPIRYRRISEEMGNASIPRLRRSAHTVPAILQPRAHGCGADHALAKRASGGRVEFAKVHEKTLSNKSKRS